VRRGNGSRRRGGIGSFLSPDAVCCLLVRLSYQARRSLISSVGAFSLCVLVTRGMATIAHMLLPALIIAFCHRGCDRWMPFVVIRGWNRFVFSFGLLVERMNSVMVDVTSSCATVPHASIVALRALRCSAFHICDNASAEQQRHARARFRTAPLLTHRVSTRSGDMAWPGIATGTGGWAFITNRARRMPFILLRMVRVASCAWLRCCVFFFAASFSACELKTHVTRVSCFLFRFNSLLAFLSFILFSGSPGIHLSLPSACYATCMFLPGAMHSLFVLHLSLSRLRPLCSCSSSSLLYVLP